MRTPPLHWLVEANRRRFDHCCAHTGRVLQKGHVVRPPRASLLDMGRAVSDTVLALHTEHGGLSAVAVEEFVRGFSGANYQTRVLFKLAQINGIVSYECMRHTSHEPYV